MNKLRKLEKWIDSNAWFLVIAGVYFVCFVFGVVQSFLDFVQTAHEYFRMSQNVDAQIEEEEEIFTHKN